MHIAVVGGMNLDILGFPGAPLLSRDSNPGQVTLRPGGVGRNIAARLQALGASVFLITALGKDAQADMLADFCRNTGLDLSFSVKTALSSPCYLCIHDEKGDMYIALSDMQAMNALTPDIMEKRMEFINQGDGCVLDANLSPETLQYIATHARVPLFLDPVSCAKAPRIQKILPYLTAIKPNLMEAEMLTGEKSPERAARILRKNGVQHVFISMGADGVYFSGPDREGISPAIPLSAIPLTGAGDALVAGVTLALLQKKSTQEAARAGCEAAHAALTGAL